MFQRHTRHKSVIDRSSVPNQWDFIVFIIIFGILAALVWGVGQMVQPFRLDNPANIVLDPSMLPNYSIRTVSRMFLAMMVSLLFTFTIGTLAAKNRKAEKVIMPFIDIMQSVPILGFLTFAVMVFMPLFPGSQLGPECGAIFAIFTSQVWNMTLGFYQSLRLLPKEMREVSAMLQLGAWQKFWRIEVPYALPSLLSNMMISMSAGWFFVVASEAIAVSNQQIHLPGIGSYIHLAVEQANQAAILYAILAMFIIILIYDQLLFRPMVAWTSRFQSEISEHDEPEAWFLDWLNKTRLLRMGSGVLNRLKDAFVNGMGQSTRWIPDFLTPIGRALNGTGTLFWYGGGTLLLVTCSVFFIRLTTQELTLGEYLEVAYLGFLTGIKVFIAVFLSSVLWVPFGVWISLRPRWAQYVQTLAQFFASFPANLVYPVIFTWILYYQLNVENWVVPLMMLGTQWYILFNVIAGMTTLPQDVSWVAKNYGVTGWLWWKRIILPTIFPYYITGAMAAAGGCWNASIVAEVIVSSGQTIKATGLGAYIYEVSLTGDMARLTLSIGVMCVYVMILNRVLWNRLYNMAESRYKQDSDDVT